VSEDGRILASYVHGLFDAPPALSALLAWASPTGAAPFGHFDVAARREADIDRLADTLEEHLDWQRLAEWLPAMQLMTHA
jgi:adenosylcobyric acid synthase